ncbi:uncharacterized protein LOC106456957 [Limulus polyphemus]|uniref:Uncharacterized protein LOC106456957 n=1 Tax=Limulus polyphemus TaxID=6850 RepID=A0ABM1AZM8_LIMPO|nr:uncharacterized protein LOC106456957 [Limulus polyphemus]
MQKYESIDTIPDTNVALNYQTEFLNSLVPPHNLELKIGTPIILLWNMDSPTPCNGISLAVKKLLTHIIEATIMNVHGAGQDVFIPCIPIIPTDLPFQFKHIQFPVQLGFAMTINKAQGQSLKVVGLNLQSSCFSHGQLYVGCSWVGDSKNLFILAADGKTTNIVYPEALQW